MKLVTQQFPIQIQSTLQLLTPAPTKHSYFRVAHMHRPMRPRWLYAAHRLRENAAKKQDDPLAIHFITPTIST